MIERMLRDKKYESAMDFGAGPGILNDEWQKYSKEIVPVDMMNPIPKRKFGLIICSSVMEFTELDRTFGELSECLSKDGDIVVASPMESDFSAVYFGYIGDRTIRNSHEDILSSMEKYFTIRKKTSWLGLYFCAIGKKK